MTGLSCDLVETRFANCVAAFLRDLITFQHVISNYDATNVQCNKTRA